MNSTVKLSHEGPPKSFWEIPILFEDEHLMALNKPPMLLTSPDRYDPNRPNLMKLLHAGIERGSPWAKERNLTYLSNAHRLDFETSGVILLAKNKPALVSLADQFGTEKPTKIYIAVIRGTPEKDEFEVDAKLSPHPVKLGQMRIDSKNGKKSKTLFSVREKFSGFTLLECRPLTGRTHQIRVHLQYYGLPIMGDNVYGGSQLLLSTIKSHYHLKPNKTERPLISSLALHAEKLTLRHPVTGADVSMEAAWPKDLSVAVKYLRRYCV
jgi:RluA family pseudouridine synthase